MQVKETKERYASPEMEVFELPMLNLMATASATGNIEDLEDGGEL